MKKILLFCLVLFTLTGCSKNNEMYYNVSKLDDYLYKIDFNDYQVNTDLENVQFIENFACSSVKNGNFYGRNYDFIYNDVIEFIVTVKANKNRHASIGVVNNLDYKEGYEIPKEYDKKLELLPNITLDGINDAGVIASINVVPKEDVLPITGTNPTKEDLHIAFIVRYILDNASSATNAIELLNERNIYGDIGEHYNLHIMIADQDKTYVVEFIDNKLVAEEKIGNEQIMTNYYVNLENLTENSAGVERYQILQDNYDEGSTFEGMWNLLQRVKYSKEYEFDKESEWYSEFVGQSIINNMNKDTKEKINNEMEKIKKEYWYARGNNNRTPANINFWFTTHNSTYDIKNRKIRVTVQENYNKYYEFNLK